MITLLGIGRIGKNISVLQRETGVYYEIPVIVSESTTVGNEIKKTNTLVNVLCFRKEQDKELDALKQDELIIFAGLPKAKFVEKENKQFSSIELTRATITAIRADAKKINHYLQVLSIGHIGNQRVNEIGERAVCNFSIANNQKAKDQNGNTTESVIWLNCSLWREKGKTNLFDYLNAGQLVAVEGKAFIQSYKDKSEQWQCQLCAIVQNVELLGGGKEGADSNFQIPEMDSDNDLSF